MFHMLVNQDSSPNGQVGPRKWRSVRQGEWVKIAVQLGPDTAAADDVERRWLSRMATRYGGSHRARGRHAKRSFCPPTARAINVKWSSYARNWSKPSNSAKPTRVSSLQSSPAGDLRSDIHTDGSARDRRPIAWNCCKIRRPRCNACCAIGWTACARTRPSCKKQLGEQAPLAQSFARRMSVGAELLGDLGLLTECDLTEPVRRVDVSELARAALQSVESRAARHGVGLSPRLPERAPLRNQNLATAGAAPCIAPSRHRRPHRGVEKSRCRSCPRKWA